MKEVSQCPPPRAERIQRDDDSPDGVLSRLPKVGGACIRFTGDDECSKALRSRISGDVFGEVPGGAALVEGVEDEDIFFGHSLRS